MRVELKASLILAGLVALLSVVLQLTGVNANFVVGQTAFLAGAIGFNVGVVYWALCKTAAEQGYGRQVLSAGIIGVIGGILIVLASWLLLSVVFPGAMDELRQAAIDYMQAAGTPEDEVRRQLETIDSATPLSQSIPGGVGTLVTSLVSGGILAALNRKR